MLQVGHLHLRDGCELDRHPALLMMATPNPPTEIVCGIAVAIHDFDWHQYMLV
jgi:hypothetical protein